MPLLSTFKPGCTIYRKPGGNRGTLTCFARRAGVEHKLYGVTANHVLPRPDCICMNSNNDRENFDVLDVGHTPTEVPRAELCYFEIYDALRLQLTEGNFMPIGHAVAPTLVWNPEKLVGKAAALNEDEEYALKQKKMNVQFVGSTQRELGNDLTPGEVFK